MSLAAKKNSTSISILPETDDRTLCVSFKGHISLEEYENIFLKPFVKMATKHPDYGLLIYYDENFKGWDKDAADSSFKSILDYASTARKLAYVNPPESKIFQIKLFQHLFGGEIRFFNTEDLDEAMTWVKT